MLRSIVPEGSRNKKDIHSTLFTGQRPELEDLIKEVGSSLVTSLEEHGEIGPR